MSDASLRKAREELRTQFNTLAGAFVNRPSRSPSILDMDQLVRLRQAIDTWITQLQTTGSARRGPTTSVLPKMIHIWKCTNFLSCPEMNGEIPAFRTRLVSAHVQSKAAAWARR